jgi:hypothetical protein
VHWILSLKVMDENTLNVIEEKRATLTLKMKSLTNSLLLFFLFTLVGHHTYGQEGNTNPSDTDHLLPLRPQFGISRKYHQKIQDVLFTGISDFQFTRFISRPSFGAESVLAIEMDTSNLNNPTFSIVYHAAKSSIWYSLNDKASKEIIVEKFRKSISMEDAKKIADLYSAALDKVRENKRFGLDGASYEFATMTQAGRAWLAGPCKPESKVERLIQLNHEFIELIKKGGRKFQLSYELLERIDTLTMEFK